MPAHTVTRAGVTLSMALVALASGALPGYAAGATTSPTRAIAACTKAAYKPASYVLTCADANVGINGATYSWWTRATAHGSGTYYFNDCKPYCAAGTVHHQHAEFTLYRVESTSAHGKLFTRIEIDTRSAHHVYQLPTRTL